MKESSADNESLLRGSGGGTNVAVEVILDVGDSDGKGVEEAWNVKTGGVLLVVVSQGVDVEV